MTPPQRPEAAHPPRPRGDGDGWVACGCGARHWGRYGAAGLLLVHDGDVLLQHRAAWSHHGGTWGLPGGARHRAESALAAALREAGEEAGVPATLVRPRLARAEDHQAWAYTTVVAAAVERFDPVAGDAESEALAWVAVDDVADLPLHPAFGAGWPALRDLLDRQLRLLVDGANVVGARPDGWWRDRPAATRRLRDGLDALAGRGLAGSALPGGVAAHRWWPRVHLVVEGAARDVAASGSVEVVAAAGAGDDALVETVEQLCAGAPGDPLVVVTADRALRARVGAARVVGPGTLWRLLEEPSPEHDR